MSGPGGESASPAAEQPTSYDYRLTSTCGERGFLGTFDVTVRDDEVVRATAVRRYRGRVRLGEVPTLTDLVEMAEGADGDAVVDLRVDRRGRPTSLRIDHRPDAIDDEECYAVDHLELRP
ncbi:DUF6174 domain-containing protein [uncultured Nocardioides sp.]|uniref:DUF6174 domain-containing protein n=1 Tax=uncultured Nocardioides sp. TaxID=198441 RepID=UPI002603010F|nr:DUF6174 domain-containing protein [uncultured Nocardioides sp.]